MSKIQIVSATPAQINEQRVSKVKVPLKTEFLMRRELPDNNVTIKNGPITVSQDSGEALDTLIKGNGKFTFGDSKVEFTLYELGPNENLSGMLFPTLIVPKNTIIDFIDGGLPMSLCKKIDLVCIGKMILPIHTVVYLEGKIGLTLMTDTEVKF